MIIAIFAYLQDAWVTLAAQLPGCYLSPKVQSKVDAAITTCTGGYGTSWGACHHILVLLNACSNLCIHTKNNEIDTQTESHLFPKQILRNWLWSRQQHSNCKSLGCERIKLKPLVWTIKLDFPYLTILNESRVSCCHRSGAFDKINMDLLKYCFIWTAVEL